jgi:hypothetical protein
MESSPRWPAQDSYPDTNMPAPPAPAKRRHRVVLLIILVGIVAFVWAFLGVYTVQPIGALPDGVTLIVWRHNGEPFFNSPDGMCLRVSNEVSLMCRAIAMGQAPVDRILLRLPYMEMAYLASTGGSSFDR